MIEAQWLTATDPVPMVDFIQTNGSERKLRLFLVACARLVWEWIPTGEARQAVEVAERHADGWASEDERDRVSKQLWSQPVTAQIAGQVAVAGSAGGYEAPRNDAGERYFAYLCAMLAVHRPAASRITSRATWVGAQRAVGGEQPRLLRDIFGNPFRPVAFSPEWRTDTAVTSARQMYESREFSAMPILADALQDAGCDSDAILSHCRNPGEHVRGCWVCDLVLGKE